MALDRRPRGFGGLLCVGGQDSVQEFDTVPLISRADFDYALKPYSARYCCTAEGLIHRSEIMSIEGWSEYGSEGNQRLTEAQRVLMMWSDLVGQTDNGGFGQFVDNYSASLALAWRLIRQLPWPDLQVRFEAAFRERAGDPAAPKLIEAPSLLDEPEKWAKNRRRAARYLLAQNRPWWRPPSRRDIDSLLDGYEDWLLQVQYRQLVGSGLLKPDGEAVFGDYDDPPVEASQAFDTWFYLPETRAASVAVIAAFVHERQAELYRLAD